jgi:hypothetical protein
MTDETAPELFRSTHVGISTVATSGPMHVYAFEIAPSIPADMDTSSLIANRNFTDTERRNLMDDLNQTVVNARAAPSILQFLSSTYGMSTKVRDPLLQEYFG